MNPKPHNLHYYRANDTISKNHFRILETSIKNVLTIWTRASLKTSTLHTNYNGILMVNIYISHNNQQKRQGDAVTVKFEKIEYYRAMCVCYYR